jgi:hypothetical protein
MKSHSLTFTGALIERGFWLYVWHVACGKKSIVYVGRTGDSSSQYAASPFNRLGQHLDVRESASANMLLRHMRKKDMDPTAGKYRMVAVGPIYPEQETMELHRRHRNVVAAMEAALGRHMKEERGYDVVGNTNSKHPLNMQLFRQVLSKFKSQLDDLPLPGA